MFTTISRLRRRLLQETLEQRINLCSLSFTETGEFVELCLPDLPDPAPVAVSRAANAVNDFAFELYEHYLAEEGNVVLSPYSIATAFGMAYAGAANQTAREIEDVFHFGDAPGIHDSFKALISYREGKEATPPPHPVLLELLDAAYLMQVSQAMWPAVGFEPGEEFVDRIKLNYRATAKALDFAADAEAARQTINQWAEDRTLGRVKELLKELSPGTQLVLTNATYFESKWAIPFDPQSAFEGSFQTADGLVTSTLMYNEGDFRFTYRDGFDVLELPFRNAEMSMVFLVPDRDHVAQDLTSQTLVDVNEWLKARPAAGFVGFNIPKFETAVSSDLIPVLSGLGMPSAFSAVADFSDIAPGLFINQVQHKASIEVNEQGTTAGAATSIGFLVCFAKGTPILTPNGSWPIEELRQGDLVLARDEHNMEGELAHQEVEETFTNQAEILHLRVDEKTIQTTAEHPFFAKKKGWTKCCQLEVGDMLLSDTHEWKRVESIHATGDVQTVYNMRVAACHTYFVGSEDWGFGIWAHNACGDIKVISADRPFHFLIRDNATNATLFIGRIDDPTQEENDLKPSVQAKPAETSLHGDANGDDAVDFNDFLLFSANFGKQVDEAIESLDFNDSGVVDFADFLILQANFGRKLR